MTLYERRVALLEPFLPLLYGRVRRDLKRLVCHDGHRPVSVLDVGGRTSPYTVGVKAAISVLDVPRQSGIQSQLHLGLTDADLRRLYTRRSNLRDVFLEDMTECTLPAASFDGVVSVEVLEHVPLADRFVGQIARVLKPGGWLYLTTPNGDYVRNEVPNYNPSHVRHYAKQELTALLRSHFGRVEVAYGVKTGRHRYRGLRGLNPRRPVATLGTMASNLLNRIESRNLEHQPRRTAHLFATAWKLTG